MFFWLAPVPNTTATKVTTLSGSAVPNAARMVPTASGLPGSCRSLQSWTDPPTVSGVDGRAGRDDLVDAVQQVVRKLDVGGSELGLKVLHRPRADDGGGYRGVAEDEGDRHMDQGDARLLGQLGQLLSGIQLALVGLQRHIEAVGEPLTRGREDRKSVG